MKKIEAITKFLEGQPYDLAKLYTPDMEVQVNVKTKGQIRDSQGELQEIQFDKDGKSYYIADGYSRISFKHFRIPWNAKDNPRYRDRPINFPLNQCAEAIGMTGWDWVAKKSRWVAFDFDSLIGHKQGLTSDELQKIYEKIRDIPYTTIYTSTGGHGYHVYIFLDFNDTISNHAEHSAVARSVLDKLSALSGIDLSAKVDTLGGNMWVWHDRGTERSYKLLEPGITMTDVPSNWRDYVDTVSRRKLTPRETTDRDLIAAAHPHVGLNEEHLRLLKWFENSNSLWYFHSENSMLVCHTYDLKRAHLDLNCKGFFDTTSTGKDQGHDQNCFAFPESDGGWIVRRHSRGCDEHLSWFTDSSGWTSCYFNKSPTLRTASRIIGGVEGEKDYHFRTLDDAIKVLLSMNIDCPIPAGCNNRAAYLKGTTDGRIIVEFDRHDDDVEIDWVKKKDRWQKAFFSPQVVDEIELPDNLIRHLTSDETELGWFINAHSGWVLEGKSNVVNVLQSKGFKRQQIDLILGRCITNSWRLVCRPFQPEYCGNRLWNRGAPQFRYNPATGRHDTWDKILTHLGKNLDDEITEDFEAIGIYSGYDYLLAWVSSLIQYPSEPLPYLTFTGPQNCGKSIFHESLSTLFTSGYIRADNSLTNPSGFNGELANAILCIVEETDLSRKGYASDRIKDWVTGRTLSIHAKHKQPYHIPNCTHWVQCTNDTSYCPVFPGDTRIVIIEVDSFTGNQEIPKPLLLEQCAAEAPQFVNTLINYKLPESYGRLRVPVLETRSKALAQESNRSDVATYLGERTKAGGIIKLAELFYDFSGWLGGTEAAQWTSRRLSKELQRHGYRIIKKGGHACVEGVTLDVEINSTNNTGVIRV